MVLPNQYSVRLKGFDYSNDWYYSVTICTQNRQELFGSVMSGSVGVDLCVGPKQSTIKIKWG